MYFKSTPKILLQTEKLHLQPEFNRHNATDEKYKAIKMLPKQIVSSTVASDAWDGYQKEQISFTGNGIYAYQKSVTYNVYQIDIHSLLGTIAFNLKKLDQATRKLFLRKKEIENTKNYQKSRLKNEKDRIKSKINCYCSTIGKNKTEHSINRSRLNSSAINLVLDMLCYFGLSNVIDVVNDGFIVKNLNDEKVAAFQKDFKKQINYLTFSVKKWKVAIIKDSQNYILINDSKDFKNRNNCLNKSFFYRELTKQPLQAGTNEYVDWDSYCEASEKEATIISILNNYLLEDGPLNGDDLSLEKMHKDLKDILSDAGIDDVNSKIRPRYYYTFSINDKDNEQQKDYINRYTKRIFQNFVYISDTKLSNEVNIFQQSINANYIDNIDKFLSKHPNYHVSHILPPIISQIKDNDINKWLIDIIDNRKEELKDNVFLYDSVANILKIWSAEHNVDPNNLLKKLHSYLFHNDLNKLTIADKVYADPATLYVDEQLMAKDSHNVYTDEPAVVNNVIDKYIDRSGMNYIDKNRNNVHSLLKNSKYKNNKLDNGFKSDHQAIWLDEKGEIRTTSPLKRKLKNHVNVNFINFDNDPKLASCPEYKQVLKLLDNLSGGNVEEFCYMLGLIPLLNTGIMRLLRCWFVILSEPGAGKTVLFKIMGHIFDDEELHKSKILAPDSNLARAFTDLNSIDSADVKKGQLMMIFDDYQANRNISSQAGIAINRVISGERLNGGAKFQQNHPVQLSPLIIVATNSLPHIRIDQVSSEARKYVFKAKTSFSKAVTVKNGDVNKWIESKRVQEALFFIIMKYAARLIKMTPNEQKKIFSQDKSVKSDLSNLSSSVLEFFQDADVTCRYDLVGLKLSSLFETYKLSTKTYKASITAFKKQIESLGFIVKRKKFRDNQYSSVICSKNRNLTNEKMNLIADDYSLFPDYACENNQYGYPKLSTFKVHHAGYEELSKKYKNNSKLFELFDYE